MVFGSYSGVCNGLVCGGFAMVLRWFAAVSTVSTAYRPKFWSQVGLLQTAHYWANAGVLLGGRMRRR